MAINPHEVNPEPLTTQVAGGAIVAVAGEDMSPNGRFLVVYLKDLSGGLPVALLADATVSTKRTGPFYLVVDTVKSGQRVVLHDRALIIGTTVGLADNAVLYLDTAGGVADAPFDTTIPVAQVVNGNSATQGAVLADVRGTLTASVAAAVAIADPGTAAAIPVSRTGVVNLTIAAGVAETNTLAVPSFTGQRLTINADTVGAGGTRAITCAQSINIAGNTIMTFNAVRDIIELVAITVGGSLRWQVLSNANVALS